MSEEKGLFPPFSGFSGALRTLWKRPKKGEKGRFRPISRKGGQTPLKTPFVTPPFAAYVSKFRAQVTHREVVGTQEQLCNGAT